MHTSGLVLDIYDDVGGAQLKTFFPVDGLIPVVPEFMKQAHALSSSDLSQLPDDAFALVLVNGDEKLRKYACIDEGNVALSVMYFVKNAHKLPDEARKVTAENLKVACGWYGLDIPVELEKEAGMVFNAIRNKPIQTAMAVANAKSVADNTGGQIKANLRDIRDAESMGGVGAGMATQGMERRASANLGLLELAQAFKVADVTGTNLMQLSKDDKNSEDPSPTRTVNKRASVGQLEQGEPVSGESPLRAPQHMSPVVDVTGKSPRKEETKKEAHFFAMPSYGRYPLDSYGQVKQASAYFEEFGVRFSPVDRHEFCVNLTKRAEALQIPVSDVVRKYGSEKYASSTELEAALDTRRQLLPKEDIVLLDKIASATATLPPDDFASLLGAFDESRGLQHQYGSHVMDPYYSTYGFEKRAEDEDTWSDVVGNYHITARELKAFGLSGFTRMHKQFGSDFAEEFRKDPIGIYKSMPVEQKKLIIRLATENSPL